MPNLCVSANASHLPSPTRRGLLTGAAAAISALAGPGQASDLVSDPDITTLSQRFTDALVAYAAAESHCDACEQRLLDECPDPPVALTRQGPLGKLKREWDHWSANELEWLLANRDRRTYWRAARKLLPVAQAYERKVRRFERACGLPAAEAAQQAASDGLLEVSEVILDTAANSVAALALKARVVKYGKPEWWSPAESHADVHERLAAQIVDAAIAMAQGRAVV